MPRTVNVLYDSRAEAEVARARLIAEVGAARIRILERSSLAELAKLSLSDADRRTYEGELSRGACLLTAEVPHDQDAERIVAIVTDVAHTAPTVSAARDPSTTGGGHKAEERVALVEEELRIGTREVVRGGATVRTHVREVPAEATVTLRQDRLEVSRRPVGRTLSDAELNAGGLLKQRVIEISEMMEEAVITKEAVVREELVVRKFVEQRTETIRETVRRTEVDIDDLAARSGRATSSRSGGVAERELGSGTVPNAVHRNADDH